jgi:hypothetical protein
LNARNINHFFLFLPIKTDFRPILKLAQMTPIVSKPFLCGEITSKIVYFTDSTFIWLFKLKLRLVCFFKALKTLIQVLLTSILKMKPNRPLFLQSNPVLADLEQKVCIKMLISTWMNEISITFSYFFQLKLILDPYWNLLKWPQLYLNP